MFLSGDHYSRLSKNELPLIDSISTCQSIEIRQCDVQGPDLDFPHSSLMSIIFCVLHAVAQTQKKNQHQYTQKI